MTRPVLFTTAMVTIVMAASTLTMAQAQELNLYSSRHYDTDEQLYSDFTEMTGITINRIEAGADDLIARIEAEGANSPADILLTVDAGRLYRAAEAGLLQPVESDVLEERIPENMQHPDNLWFGFSNRARVIYYDVNDVGTPPQTYQELANDEYEGLICIRSGSNIYSLSLLAALVDHLGEDAARGWASAVLENFARDPQGGDTDQLRGIVSGECDIAVGNTYYFARALASDVEGLTGSTDMFGIVFPNQDGIGTHVNISGAGVVATAPNYDNAVAFLEYLASESAQNYFSAGNHEYPVVDGVEVSSALGEITPEGGFVRDDIDMSIYGANQALAQQIYDEIGWE